jgi:hypothetical protein
MIMRWKKNNYTKVLSLPPKHIFLIDALGALLTCIVLSLLLPHFSSEFGVDQSVFHLLAAIVACFFIYSGILHILQPKNWVLFLRIIAAANVMYCLATMLLIILLKSQITLPGVIYFIAEAMIILWLAFFEFEYAKKASQR